MEVAERPAARVVVLEPTTSGWAASSWESTSAISGLVGATGGGAAPADHSVAPAGLRDDGQRVGAAAGGGGAGAAPAGAAAVGLGVGEQPARAQSAAAKARARPRATT